MTIKEIIDKINKFPSKIDETLGEILKEYPDDVEATRILNKNSKTIMYKYFFEVEKQKYLLIEEYLFKERETSFDLHRAVGKNFYIYKD